MSWLSSWLHQHKTVADIVAPITRIVDELHSHAEKQDKAANEHIALVDQHSAAAAAAQTEANHAEATASKIAGLVGS